MKLLKQFSIILLVTFVGEALSRWIPLPVPAGIYGLLLLLLLLCLRVIRVEQVKEASSLLLELMPLMFVPAAVGLMLFWDELKPLLVPLAVITVVSTIVVMAASGGVAQLMLRRGKGGKHNA